MENEIEKLDLEFIQILDSSITSATAELNESSFMRMLFIIKTLWPKMETFEITKIEEGSTMTLLPYRIFDSAGEEIRKINTDTALESGYSAEMLHYSQSEYDWAFISENIISRARVSEETQRVIQEFNHSKLAAK